MASRMAYSRPGSTTDLAARFIADAQNIKPKFVSVGGPSGSRTQLMSGQVDSGWSVYPLNKNLLREGKIRIIGTGKEASGLNGVTIRVIAANVNWLNKNRDVAKRLMTAFKESVRHDVFEHKASGDLCEALEAELRGRQGCSERYAADYRDHSACSRSRQDQ